MTHYWKIKACYSIKLYFRTDKINNSQVRRCWNTISQSKRIATSQLSSGTRGRKDTCPWKAQWRGDTSHAALNPPQLRFQDLPLEFTVKLCKLQLERWGSAEVAPCWKASPTDQLRAHPAFPVQEAASPVPVPGSPPAAPVLSTDQGTVCGVFCRAWASYCSQFSLQ